MNRKTFVLLTLSLSGLGCKNVLEPKDVAGSYVAVRFIFSDGLEETDVLEAGGDITMTLTADGTSSGTLFVPAALTEDQMDFTADLTGTFTITDDIIHFTQAADTFVRDSNWVLDGNRLSGGGVFSGTTIFVELFRT